MDLELLDILGKDFREGGRGPTHYDCYGLCLEVAKRMGFALPQFYTPTTLRDKHKLYCKNKEVFTQLSKPVPYCLATFILRAPFVTHVGVVLEDCKSFIHILKDCKVAIEKIHSLNWQNKLEGFYVYPTHTNK